MIRAKLVLLAVITILSQSTPSMADDTAKPEQPEALKKFCVYGGSCSRSIRVQGSYATIQEAAAAAEKCRTDKLNYVSIRTGATDNDYFGMGATQYQVYAVGCRVGWSLQATVDSADKANELAEQFKKDGRRFEVVLVYAAK